MITKLTHDRWQMYQDRKNVFVNGKSLEQILLDHKRWLTGDAVETYDLRANLNRANLSGVDLSGVDLSYAYMYGTNLSGANLSGANLSGANLGGANLFKTRLDRTWLNDANLSGANLCYADLREANLTDANLNDANLSSAKLIGAMYIPYIPYACPESGKIIGYKKAVIMEDNNWRFVIVCLEIPEDAKRTSAGGRKCRCDKAGVLSITSIDGKTYYEKARSRFDREFTYKVGNMVSVRNFCENRWDECSSGIHFFLNRQEAVSY